MPQLQQFRDEDGNIWEGTSPDDPNLRLVSEGGGAVVLPPAPPTPNQAPVRTPAGGATEGLKPGFMWVDPNNPSAGQMPVPTSGSPSPTRPDITAAAYAEAVQGFTASMALGDIIRDLEAKFDAGPGATRGVYGAQDFIPSPANQEFDRAANAARGTVATVLGFTGGQLNSATEAQMNLGPFIPSASDFDQTSMSAIKRLKDLQRQGLQRSVAILGGAIDASGNVIPIPRGLEVTPENINKVVRGEPQDEQISAFDVVRTVNTQGPTGAAPRADVGSGQTVAEEYPPRMVAAHDDMVRRLLSEGGGRIDPQAYAAERGKLFQEFNFQSDPQTSAEWATGVNQYLDAGGRTIPSGILPFERVATATETMRNNLVNNPAGGFAAGLGNAASFGAVEGFLPDQYMALEDAQGFPVIAGEIGGALAGTRGLGAAGRAAAGRFAPSLLGGAGRAQFARNVATDAAYGGAFGGMTVGDPLTGAALGAGGSAIGQGLGNTLASTVGGMQRNAAAQALVDQGVPMSVGRQVGLGRAEDVLSSLPFANEAVRNRQIDSFVGFDEAAFRQAAGPATGLSNPITPSIRGVGRTALKDLRKVENQAYDRALSGVSARIDGQFTQDFAGVAGAVRALPDDYRRAAEAVMRTRVGEAVKGGAMTGKEYQQAIRGIRSAKSKANMVGVSGNEDQYIEALNKAEDALTGVIQRNAGQSTIDDLALANQIYSNRKILENASLDRAKGGARSGEVEVFTPSQLIESARMAEKRYGTGEGLLKFGQAGQSVLPSTVPNSATADRLLAASVLTGAAGTGGAFGYDQTQGPQSAQSAAGSTAATVGGLGALLGALGTRRGQQVLEQILLTRPQGMQAVGQGIRRRRGLFGSAAVPVALDYQ